MSLYQKYRPTTLNRVLGCPETTQALGNMLQRGTLPHALLFYGPSGCGKTTLARICKDELKCSDLDYQELNSAGYSRGIDSIRDISRVMRLAPANGPCRVWLLDECHQLSKDAQNAALKMTEDTPPHVYFFFCTTEPEKLLPTVVQRFNPMPVRALGEDDLEVLCRKVSRKESITLSDTTVAQLVASATGSARTLLVLLENIAALAEDQREGAIERKAAELNEAIDLCRALIDRKSWANVAQILKNLKGEPEQVRYAVIGYARSVLLNKGGWQAYNVIMAFKQNFFDSKAAGLAAAAYEAVNAKQ